MSTRNLLLFLFSMPLFLFACGGSDSSPAIEVPITAAEPPRISFELDVESSVLSGMYMFNGQLAWQSAYRRGEVFIYANEREVPTYIGSTSALEYSARLVHGEYDARYDYVQGEFIPVNEDALVNEGIDFNADTYVDIDIPVVNVRPVITLNGGGFPNSVYESGEIFLQSVSSGELISIGVTSNMPDSIWVVPGEYHVVYQLYNGGDLVPINSNARIASNIALIEDGELIVDVQSSLLTATFTHNGADFVSSPYAYANFFLVNSETQDEAYLGRSYHRPDGLNVINGSYHLEYRHVAGDFYPINAAKIVQKNIEHFSDAVYRFPVSSHSWQVSLSLNGDAFPASVYHRGEIHLVDEETGSYSLLGASNSALEPALILAGTYSLAYTHVQGNLVPQNTRAVVASAVSILEAGTLELDIEAAIVATDVTLNGAAFPSDGAEIASLLLEGSLTEAPVVVATTDSQAESTTLVILGDYDFRYRCEQCVSIPWNSHTDISSNVAIAGNTTLSHDLTSVRVDLSVTHNGEPFPASAYESGHIWGGTQESEAFFFGRTHQFNEDIILIEGDYTLYYKYSNGGELVPINEWIDIGQRSLLKSDEN
ncbi:hypothetical protein [Simiduia aestuariiviva]|uniref:DUF4382 domain-containing protein n=1 Tax=Simiduia aestuariiviva TaxID=1510459 RepID=A0A839UNT1_9GAMM|nr:hypothetical protein [Simiduia aestuariiviva]MBB3167406.1 hypothetical protein [Simiduia aestuariiviva]